jgi:hypothetical protein
MINFNELPGSKPKSGVAKGCYIATIETAEMKQGKDASKPKYLSMRLGLSKADAKPIGKVFDILTESDSEIPRFKLRRFIEALRIPITGDFDLKDLVKIIVGKRMLVDICPEKRDGVLSGYDTVDVSSGDIYYDIAEASRKMEGAIVDPTSGNIAAADAEDAGEY